ncbi:MAG: Flp pilus assembly protein CpaB, partial [Acidobacteriota bacterium]
MGELLKRRVRIILSNKWKTARLRWVQAFILLGSLIILPLGLESAQSSSSDTLQSQREETTLPSSIPDGMRAVSVKVNSVISTDYFLPGTRVDVIRTGIPREGVSSRIFFENIQVLSSGQVEVQNSDGQPKKVTIVTLLVTQEQAQKLILAGTDNI